MFQQQQTYVYSSRVDVKVNTTLAYVVMMRLQQLASKHRHRVVENARAYIHKSSLFEIQANKSFNNYIFYKR